MLRTNLTYFSLLYFQENPSEEDGAVVDKIMSSRIVKKEVMFIFSLTLVQMITIIERNMENKPSSETSLFDC